MRQPYFKKGPHIKFLLFKQIEVTHIILKYFKSPSSKIAKTVFGRPPPPHTQCGSYELSLGAGATNQKGFLCTTQMLRLQPFKDNNHSKNNETVPLNTWGSVGSFLTFTHPHNNAQRLLCPRLENLLWLKISSNIFEGKLTISYPHKTHSNLLVNSTGWTYITSNPKCSKPFWVAWPEQRTAHPASSGQVSQISDSLKRWAESPSSPAHMAGTCVTKEFHSSIWVPSPGTFSLHTTHTHCAGPIFKLP